MIEDIFQLEEIRTNRNWPPLDRTRLGVYPLTYLFLAWQEIKLSGVKISRMQPYQQPLDVF